MSAAEVGALIRSLTPEQREKLVEGLNAASYQDLAGLKGVGPSTMGDFLGISRWTLRRLGGAHDQVFQFWRDHGGAWPTFTRREDLSGRGEGVHYERTVPGLYSEGYLQRLFCRESTMLSIFAHFNICVTDINEHLTEFRDIRARLAIFKTIDDPIMRDCLEQLSQDLAKD